MIRRRTETYIIFFIIVLAAILRSLFLDIKPPHYDECINGFFVSKMWREGFYHYDPTNFHGPLFFYFLQLAELLFGHNIAGYRFMNGLISLASVWQLISLRRFLGRAALWSATGVAVSAGFVFYSRYAIHESLFIYFQILFVFAYFLWEEKRSLRAVILMVLSFFGAFSVKETFFIFFGTWVIALACVRFYFRLVGEAGEVKDENSNSIVIHQAPPSARQSGWLNWQEVATANDWGNIIAVVLLLTIFLFTGFFLNPAGIHDMYLAFVAWTKTGTGHASGHEKPMWYWLSLLSSYEWPALSALVASVPLFFFVGRRAKILILVAIGTLLAYSLIPYKTPWIILNIIWPLALVFGLAVERLSQIPVRKVILISRVLAVAIIVGTLPIMLRLNFKDFTNKDEPYVYVQSTGQMKVVIDEIENRVKSKPEAINMKLFVLIKDTWPLPWIFGMYPNLSYGQADTAIVSGAQVVLVDGSMDAILTSHLQGHYFRQPFQLRDAYENGFAYLEEEMFKDIVPPGTPMIDFEGVADSTKIDHLKLNSGKKESQ